jgi:hypothetical protein
MGEWLQGQHWRGALKGHELAADVAEEDQKRILLERFQLEVRLWTSKRLSGGLQQWLLPARCASATTSCWKLASSVPAVLAKQHCEGHHSASKITSVIAMITGHHAMLSGVWCVLQ